MNGTALVRRPSGRLAEGIVTHISRTTVDVELARSQHAAYADARRPAAGRSGRRPPPMTARIRSSSRIRSWSARIWRC